MYEITKSYIEPKTIVNGEIRKALRLGQFNNYPK